MFLLSDCGNERAFTASLDLGLEEANTLLRGGDVGRQRISAAWSTGSNKPGDFVWTTLAVSVLVSGAVVQRLRDHQLTGWEVRPVELRGKDGERLPDYYFLVITGRCGAVDNARSVLVEKKYPGGLFPIWKGLYFEVDTWDGADLFMPSGSTGWILAVDQVQRVLGGFKNLECTRLDQVERITL